MQRIFTTSLCKWLLTLFITCVGFAATATEHIAARGYWEDKTSQATFEQAQVQQYTPFEGVLSRGYTQSATWIRLTITPPVGEDELVLRIRPVYLDEITLYDPLDTSGKQRKTGDTADYKDNEYKSLSHTFVIPAGTQQRDVWLRMKTNSTSLMNIEAFTVDEMQDSEFNMQLTHFAVLAVIAMFMLLVLISWFNYRESLYAFFVVRQTYNFFYMAALFGLHRYFLSNVMSAPSIDLLYSWMVLCATAITLVFEYKFLQEYSSPRWTKAVWMCVLIWSLTVMVLLAAGYVSIAVKYNMVLNTVGMFLLPIFAVSTSNEKNSQSSTTASLLPKKFVVGYYMSIALVLIFSVLPYLGVIKGNEFAVNGLIFFTLCSSLIMTVMMQLRASQIRKAQIAFEQELLLSKKEVELEKHRREEQTHLLHMLMHELKNPLAIIDMALLAKNDLQKTSGYVSRAVGNMKSILERCVKTDKLTEGSVNVHKEQVNVNQFLHDLLVTLDHDATQVSLEVFGALTVYTDEQYFEIMCSNLIENAVRYGDTMMPVVVQAEQQMNGARQRGVCITVSNRPSTASWPDPDRVFSKYYRSLGAEAQSGTGLGLYLVRTLARLVGGDCVYAPDDKNIRFELWLPS
jgi:signal transduction histidine kinase